MVRTTDQPMSTQQAKAELRDAAAMSDAEAQRWLTSHALELAAGAFIIGFALGAEPRVARRIREVALPLARDGLSALADYALAAAAAHLAGEARDHEHEKSRPFADS